MLSNAHYVDSLKGTFLGWTPSQNFHCMLQIKEHCNATHCHRIWISIIIIICTSVPLSLVWFSYISYRLQSTKDVTTWQKKIDIKRNKRCLVEIIRESQHKSQKWYLFNTLKTSDRQESPAKSKERATAVHVWRPSGHCTPIKAHRS